MPRQENVPAPAPADMLDTYVDTVHMLADGVIEDIRNARIKDTMQAQAQLLLCISHQFTLRVARDPEFIETILRFAEHRESVLPNVAKTLLTLETMERLKASEWYKKLQKREG